MTDKFFPSESRLAIARELARGRRMPEARSTQPVMGVDRTEYGLPWREFFNKRMRDYGGQAAYEVPVLGEALSARDAYQKATNGQYVNAMISGAGAVPFFPVPAMKMTRKSGTFLNDPPAKPQRPFNDDYPRSPRHDRQGRLEETIDGHRLDAPFVAGRVRRDEPESRILPEQSVQIAEAILGTGPRAEPRSVLGRNLGTYDSRGIRYRDDLDDRAKTKIINHELGHAIDEISGQIKSDGIKSELARLYSGSVSGNFDRTRNLTLPEHVGYRKAESDREMMAEAIRIYMTDPNYLKTVAPKTAKRIRETVNTNPKIARTLQFNSLIAGGILSGAAYNQEAEQ